MLGMWFLIMEEVNTNVRHWYLSDISSSWPSFIHITWTLASDTSHSKVALFFSVIFRSFSCLVNSITRAAARGETTATTSLPELDDGDVVYVCASSGCLRKPWSPVYDSALMFITSPTIVNF